MAQHRLRFIASATCMGNLIQTHRLYIKHGITEFDCFSDFLLVPLLSDEKVLRFSREHAEKGSFVMFDSGGYQVQTGKLSHADLYAPLMALYRANPWASVYTLPDYPASSNDSPDAIEEKVKQTIESSVKFFQQLPDDLKPRAMAVIQGRTEKQIDACLKAYLAHQIPYLGFGAFGAAGKNGAVNIMTNSALARLEKIAQVAREKNILLHVFGIGSPAHVKKFKELGVSMFDSTSWSVAVGYGKIFLPFSKSYNVLGKNISEESRKHSRESFLKAKWITGHRCPFCENFQQGVPCSFRKAHNLYVIKETVDRANKGDYTAVQRLKLFDML